MSLHLFENESDFWVAEDLSEAARMAMAYYKAREFLRPEELVSELRQVEDRREITVCCKAKGEPDDGPHEVCKTAAEWAVKCGKDDAPAFSRDF